MVQTTLAPEPDDDVCCGGNGVRDNRVRVSIVRINGDDDDEEGESERTALKANQRVDVAQVIKEDSNEAEGVKERSNGGYRMQQVRIHDEKHWCLRLLTESY